MREFLSWAKRHYRIDVTAATVERKTSELASAGLCPGGCKDLSHKGSNARFIRKTCKICGTGRSADRRLSRRDPTPCPHRHTDNMAKQCAHGNDMLHCGTHIDSVPREIYNALEATRSASSNRDEELAICVLKDATITKRQLDLATKLMLEQVYFSWLALIARPSHQPHSFCSESSPCTSMTTKH